MSFANWTVWTGALALLASGSLHAGGADAMYISLPDRGEVRKLDLTTGQLEPWATGIFIPFYGKWGKDDSFYIQDAGLGAIWKVAPNGTKKIVTAGGFIKKPLSVTIHPATGMLYVTDSYYQHIVIVDPVTGQQTVFVENVGGRFNIPGGLAFDREGNLFMTDHGTNDIMKIDPAGNVSEFLDGPSNGIRVPAGIEIDGAGNIFVASYENNNILRIRHDTAEWEVFCSDPILDEPNDIEFDADGSLIVCSAGSTSVVKIDALGHATLVHQDAGFGEWIGVSIRRTDGGPQGTMTAYGAGAAGAGGFVPRLSGIFSPSRGGEVGYVVDRATGGVPGVMLWGLGAGDNPFLGGSILVDFSQPWGLFHVAVGGSGAGQGELRMRVVHPDDPLLDGAHFYLQVLLLDPLAPFGVAMTQGLAVSFP